MPQRHRLLVLPAEYPDLADPLEFNGSWVEEQTRVVARRYQVTVVYPLLIRGRPPAIEEYRSTDLTTHIVRYRHLPKTWLLSYGMAVLRGVKVSGLRPECIHAHGLYPAGLVALGLGKWLGVPVVVTEHWGRLSERVAGSKLMAVVLPLILRGARTVVAVSEALASEMLGIEPRCRPVVVPNTVLPGFFQLPLMPTAGPLDRLQLLFVGSLHDQRKGLADLLQALALYSRSPDSIAFHLTVIGEGAARPGFERLVTELGLSDCCTFLGNRTRREVVSAMGKCHALAVPSRYETFGVVFAEAMAAGKPVIACLGGPAEEIVPRWAGLLVPPSEPAALRSAIDSLAKHRGSFDGARSRSHAWEKFGPDTFLEAITSVYEEVLRPLHSGGR